MPSYPDVPGLREYKGRVLHTSTWPAELEDVKTLKGKEIMVVGNGCSGYVEAGAVEGRQTDSRVQLVAALSKEPDIKVIPVSRSQHWIVRR